MLRAHQDNRHFISIIWFVVISSPEGTIIVEAKTTAGKDVYHEEKSIYHNNSYFYDQLYGDSICQRWICGR